MEAEFFHADERTDRHINMTKRTVAFRRFTYELKIPIQNKTHLHKSIILYIGLFFNHLCFLFFRYYNFSLTELGRLYRYESSSVTLRHIYQWRASDLLVWNSADTTCKTKRHVVIVVDIFNTLISKCVCSL